MNKEWQERIDSMKTQVWPWWWELIQKWFENLYEDNPKYDISTICCKEKYWTLRFEFCLYEDILHQIETASQYICETCWKIWKTRFDLCWYRTLCDEHYNELINKKWD